MELVGRGGSSASAPEYGEIGDRLRAARTARGLSLRSLAERLGVSPSLISQVERGLARPSVNTLYAMSRELDVSLDELLFADARRSTPGTNGRRSTDSMTAAIPDLALLHASRADRLTEPSDAPIQRADSRKVIRLASGVVWERLTTVNDPNVDFLYVTYEVGGASSPEHEFQRHSGHEWGYVLTGRLGVTVAFDDHVLEPGDAISFESTVPHRMYNLGDEPVHGIWFVMGRRRFSDLTSSGSGLPFPDRRASHGEQG